MSGIISGNMVGGTAPIKTIKIIDNNNNEYVGVIVGSEVIFTATDDDVVKGKVYAGDNGVSVGVLELP
jgi:DUF2075 family protein